MYFQDYCKSKSRTLIMGIINITPDSFYDGGKYLVQDKLVARIKKLKNIDIIDVGAESSRPGSDPISSKEEIERIKTFIESNSFLDKYYSIDTYKPKVAEYSIQNGFNMINDISGGDDIKMFEIAAKYNVPIVIMHMQGKPKTMQKNPKYSNPIDNIINFFEERIKLAKKIGIHPKQIILDPGIGFGKTIIHNDMIIKNLKRFKIFNIPIMVGISRKSFLSTNNNQPSDRLGASLAVTSIAIFNGADIVRVHDINNSKETFAIIDRITREL